MNKFPLIVKAVKEAGLIELPQENGSVYQFRTYPFGERGTYFDSDLMTEISEGLCASIQGDFDYIVSPAPGGNMWGLLVAQKLDKPINILRFKPSQGDNKIKVSRQTGYRQHYLYFNNLSRGDKVHIIDDVVSTGGTLNTILGTLIELGVIVQSVHIIFAKTDDYKAIAEKYGIPINVLVSHSET